MKHAVFATDFELNRHRVSGWLDWNAAQDAWELADNKRRRGEITDVKFVEVRSQDDPGYRLRPYSPWLILSDSERPTWVSLDRVERSRLLDIGRRAGDLESAADAMFTELCHDARWAHLAAVTISDYTWAAARFCFPQEAKYL